MIDALIGWHDSDFKSSINCAFAAVSIQGYYLPTGSVPGDKCLPCPENGICKGKLAAPFPAPVCALRSGRALVYVQNRFGRGGQIN